MQYEYNDRGLLRRILGGPSGNIVSNIAYLPSTLIGRINYGNGVVTTQAYDRRLRLKHLRSQSGSATINSEYINLTYEMDGVSNITLIRDARPEAVLPNGDPRRNTQSFHYDDLYRLTRVQYSFAVPGGADRNDGQIDYRFDRIGNMLSQTSSISEERNGTPVVNLGAMDSGGSNGRSGRTGRLPEDSPGPHALTAVRDTQGRTRDFAYDANGNVTVADGMACTWDFKDRLSAVENTNMRAAYTYDYTDRRITKRVFWKRGEPVGTNQPPSLAGGPATTSVSYVNKFFEAREHDTPVKYVWSGNTRVARVSGSLLTNARVQRLRLSPGWNLCSLVVTAEAALKQMLDFQAAVFDPQSVWKWSSATLDWVSVSEQETLPAGAVLWIHALTNATLSVTGTYAAPGDGVLAATTGFWPNAAFETWDLAGLQSALQSGSAWAYDATASRWLSLLPAKLTPAGDLPPALGPGQALFLAASVPVQIQMPSNSSAICYFHQDHVGSTALVTDSQGIVVQETALFPFGAPRHETGLARRRVPYQFAQKERDAESSLDYFETRFLNASLGRFFSADPALGAVSPRNTVEPAIAAPLRLRCQ